MNMGKLIINSPATVQSSSYNYKYAPWPPAWMWKNNCPRLSALPSCSAQLICHIGHGNYSYILFVLYCSYYTLIRTNWFEIRAQVLLHLIPAR